MPSWKNSKKSEIIATTLRLRKKEHSKLKALADDAGMTMNQFLKSLIQNYEHPIQHANTSDFFNVEQRDIQNTLNRIEEINQKQTAILQQQQLQRFKIADLGQEDSKIQQKILDLLKNEDRALSEIEIADHKSIHQDPDIIFVILSYLEKIGKIEMINQKWKLIS